MAVDTGCLIRFPYVMPHPLPDIAAEQQTIVGRGRRLAYWTVLCTAVEAGASIAAAINSKSAALTGFGADSLIEVFSALVVLWRLQAGFHGEKRETIALRLVGASLLALAVFVSYEAVTDLVQRHEPEKSWWGVGIAVFSLVTMRWLAVAKRRVAVELNSGAVRADSMQSEICSYLAAILLAGLALHAIFGWWWADPVAALAMVPLIVREGWEACRGNACCH